MKFFNKILLFGILIMIVSCSNDKKYTINSDLDAENLKGNVILIIEDNNFSQRVSYSLYDTDGNLTKTMERSDNEEFKFLDNVDEFIYADGKIQKINRKNIESNIFEIFYYGTDGKLNSSETFNEKGKISERKFFEFDDNGNKISDSTLFGEIPHNHFIINKYYFENNKLRSKKLYSSLLDGSKIYTYKYVFDSQGNWIQQKVFVNGKFQNDINRQIFYEGQDVSEYENKFNLLLNQLKPSSDINNSSVGSLGSETNGAVIGSDSPESEDVNSNENKREQTEMRKCSRCSGTGECSTCMKTFTTHSWEGKDRGWRDRNETRLGQVMCTTCRGAGVNYGRHPLGEDPESKECYVSSCNIGWLNCPDCNYNGNGNNIGECRYCKGTGSEK